MINKIIILLLLSNLFFNTKIIAQNVGISSATGTFTPNGSSILDISSTNLGLMIPQPYPTTGAPPATLNAIAQGLLFYNTAATFLYVNNSSSTTASWATLPNGYLNNSLTTSSTTLTSTLLIGGVTTTGNLNLTSALSAAAWSLSAGNSINSTSTATYGSAANGNYLGTSNAQDLVLVANKIERMRILNGTVTGTTAGSVGIGTSTPYSTLEVNGTLASSMTKDNFGTSAAPITTSIIYISSTTSITASTILYIPLAASCPNRRYLITNTTPSSLTLNQSYLDYNGASQTVLFYYSTEIISDGTNWRQISVSY